LVRYGVKEKVPVMQALQTLLPTGERLYLKLESNTAAMVIRRLTVDIHVNDLRHHALQVHLSAPNILNPESGKVFVACGSGAVAGANVLRLIAITYQGQWSRAGRPRASEPESCRVVPGRAESYRAARSDRDRCLCL
jgi:hypothetical protein